MHVLAFALKKIALIYQLSRYLSLVFFFKIDLILLSSYSFTLLKIVTCVDAKKCKLTTYRIMWLLIRSVCSFLRSEALTVFI